jgi:hypothetical protein
MTATSTPITRSPRALVITLILGLASAGLYLLLYLFSDKLPELAAATRQGVHKIYALVPIVIALVFSFVHGAFTGHFWDLLGFRAKK